MGSPLHSSALADELRLPTVSLDEGAYSAGLHSGAESGASGGARPIPGNSAGDEGSTGSGGPVSTGGKSGGIRLPGLGRRTSLVKPAVLARPSRSASRAALAM